MVARYEEDFDDEPSVEPEREANTPEELLRTCLPCDIVQAAMLREQFTKIDAGSDLAYLQFSFRSLCNIIADCEATELPAALQTMKKISDVMRLEMATLHAFLEKVRREKEPDE